MRVSEKDISTKSRSRWTLNTKKESLTSRKNTLPELRSKRRRIIKVRNQKSTKMSGVREKLREGSLRRMHQLCLL